MLEQYKLLSEHIEQMAVEWMAATEDSTILLFGPTVRFPDV